MMWRAKRSGSKPLGPGSGAPPSVARHQRAQVLERRDAGHELHDQRPPRRQVPEDGRHALERVVRGVAAEPVRVPRLAPVVELLARPRRELAHRLEHPEERLQAQPANEAHREEDQPDVPRELDVHRWPLDLDGDLLAVAGTRRAPAQSTPWPAARGRTDRRAPAACAPAPRETPARRARTGNGAMRSSRSNSSSQYSSDTMSGCSASIWPNLMKLPPRSSNSRRNRCGPVSRASATRRRATATGGRIQRDHEAAAPCASSTRAMCSSRRAFVPAVFTSASPAVNRRGARRPSKEHRVDPVL